MERRNRVDWSLPLPQEYRGDSNKASTKYSVLSMGRKGSSKELFLIYTRDTGTVSNSVNKMKCQLGRAQAPRATSPSEELILQQSDI